jgi:hypothetical protein
MSATHEASGAGESTRTIQRRSFLRSGGWIVVVALVVTTIAFAFYVVGLLRHRPPRAPGDGRHVESYRFALTPCLVRRDLIVAAGMPKDGLQALVDPPAWTTAEADVATTSRSRFLVPGDRVIGVRLQGAARAYPLRLLVWHEVVNDRLGGEPIVVTYNPLCDSAAVLRREIVGAILEFGVSGLLFNSNLLLYDRRPHGDGESLWSQLEMRAVAGPAAAVTRTLEPLPISVESWGDWRATNPDTTVLAPDPRLAERYASDPYTSYFGSDELRFPVAPLPPPPRYPLKTPVVAVGRPGRWVAFPFPVVGEFTQTARTPGGPASGPWAALSYRPNPPTVAVNVRRLPPGVSVAYALSFAWYATHRDDTVWVRGDGSLAAPPSR